MIFLIYPKNKPKNQKKQEKKIQKLEKA